VRSIFSDAQLFSLSFLLCFFAHTRTPSLSLIRSRLLPFCRALTLLRAPSLFLCFLLFLSLPFSLSLSRTLSFAFSLPPLSSPSLARVCAHSLPPSRFRLHVLILSPTFFLSSSCTRARSLGLSCARSLSTSLSSFRLFSLASSLSCSSSLSFALALALALAVSLLLARFFSPSLSHAHKIVC